MLLLLSVKYAQLEFGNILLGAETEADTMDAATELSDDFLSKEYHRALMEVKLYGDALVKERRSREVGFSRTSGSLACN